MKFGLDLSSSVRLAQTVALGADPGWRAIAKRVRIVCDAVSFRAILRNMSNYSNDETRHYAELFKALSNPHRLHIFLYLASSCVPGQASTSVEMRTSVGELADGLDISPSTVSHHLRELRQAGLIRMERRGKHVDCWVEPETLASLARFFREAGGN